MPIDKLLKVAEDLARGIISEEAEQIDLEARWPEKSLRAIQQAGLAGLVISPQLGGHGAGLYGLVRVCEIFGAHCASTSMCFGMHTVGSAVIASKATPVQQKNYLEPIVAGKHLTTLGLSEPGTGAHFYYPQTKLEVQKEGYLINGNKTFITNGSKADSYVISTVAVDPTAPPNQFSCVVIDNSSPGLQWGDNWNGMGMRGNSSKSLEIKNLLIRPDNLLGEQGQQLWYVFNVVAPYFLMAMAGTYLGIAQSAFDEARNHLSRRNYSHSGTSLSQVGVLQHRLGTLWAKIERTRRLIYYAAQEGDLGDFSSVPALLSAKAEVAHCAVDVVNEAMTLCGGIAYRDNSKFNVLLRDARAAHVMSPTTDLLYTWLGRALLDQPILGD